MIDWTIFLEILNQVRSPERSCHVGRPPFDVQILVLKNLYNLSDDQLELQIRDRLSFRDFWGLTFANRVPDSKTIWLFGEHLTRLGLSEPLFKRFDEELHKRDVLVRGGIIVDGTFVDVPKQDFSKDDYAQIKKGEKHDGYKNHVKANSDTKIITDYKVQKANNKLKSKTRSRIEHIFGAQKMRMGNEIL